MQTHHDNDTHRRVLGSTALFTGVGLLGLLLWHAATGLPWSMPRSWYSGGPLWGGLSFTLIAVGWVLLRATRPTVARWKPSNDGVRFNQVTVYSREGCHLCDDAKDILEIYRLYLPTIEEVEIDDDPLLKEKFHTCVPVVEFDGKIRFRGKIDELLLRRLIEGTAPLKSGAQK